MHGGHSVTVTVFQIDKICKMTVCQSRKQLNSKRMRKRFISESVFYEVDPVVEFDVNFSQNVCQCSIFPKFHFHFFSQCPQWKNQVTRKDKKKCMCSNSNQEENRLSLPRRSFFKKRGSTEIESKKRGTQLCLRGG